ncbi:MAG TPA: GAF domain-containing protein, partial [Mycobacteriales bacterium]|nr:GAF domain-containing protein [Mycobacteriales bacterium]
MTVPRIESALPAGEDPAAYARVLRRVRDAALGGADTPAPAPRAVIAASWRRVRSGGLDPAGPAAVPPLDPAELHRRRATSGLAELMPVLRARLLPAAEAAGQVLVVVDPSGRVLWREGGPAVRRRADALGFVEGSAWDESSVGTNAIGTSLVVDAPLHVYAAEHYAESHQPWTCAAAPLHDPVTGRLLGVVDLSGPAHTVHPATVALVDAVCRLASLELVVASERRLARLRALAAPVLARLAGPALVVAADGEVAAAVGLLAPGRVVLPAELRAGEAWLPALGRCAVEPLPGGWLLRPGPAAGAARAATLRLDLSGPVARVQVTGESGRWEAALGTRHAEILLALVRHRDGRSAAQLARDLFGDPTRTVTVRAEVSRLRRTLGPLLGSSPYRIASDVQASLRLPDDPAQLLPASTA